MTTPDPTFLELRSSYVTATLYRIAILRAEIAGWEALAAGTGNEELAAMITASHRARLRECIDRELPLAVQADVFAGSR